MAGPPETPALGLRERKKLQTRELIAETARRLFTERGFEHVPVAEVARAADVSVQTVFNYFPRKEDLVFWRLGSFEEELLGAVRDREPGEPVIAAFRSFLLTQRGLLGRVEPEARERLAALTRMISESPALLAREQQIFAQYTDSLAGLIAADEGADAGDLRPLVVANALMGVHRGMVHFARERVLAGARHPQLARAVRKELERALGLLEEGLGGYALGGARGEG